MFFIDELI